jgi:hypothetical protein
MSKNKYIWELCEKHWSYFYDHISRGIGYYNMPVVRSKSGYRNYLRTQATIEDYSDYRLKKYSKESMSLRDDYEDTAVAAYSERKSWKRNSKRRHQWKQIP